jgi:metal-sulfur cluster biosynthetic enzyme
LSMANPDQLHAAILQRLTTVIDPETGVDVVRMRLIEDLLVDQHGWVQYKFRPSSPLCPIAIPLALMIQSAIASVPGVVAQEIEVVGFIQADELTTILREMWANPGNQEKAN